jgi:hypothetical protein
LLVVFVLSDKYSLSFTIFVAAENELFIISSVIYLAQKHQIKNEISIRILNNLIRFRFLLFDWEETF